MPLTIATDPTRPMYGTVTTALIKQGAAKSGSSARGSNSLFSRIQMEQVLTVAVGVGGSYAAFRATVFFYRMASGETGATDDDENYDEDNILVAEAKRANTKSKGSPFLLGWIRRLLRRLLLDDEDVTFKRNQIDLDAAGENDTPDKDGGAVITHRGSCHCESIHFEVFAPRQLTAQDGLGKISYSHIQVQATQFRIFAGYECLKMYYVYSHTGNGKKGAHGFCERCGVHLLFAPSKTCPMLFVNANCLKENGIGKIQMANKKHSVSDSFAADGQWDNSDHLSTISEVTQPFHFQLHSKQDAFDSRRGGRGWKHQYSSGGSSSLYDVDEGESGVEVVARDHGGIPRHLYASSSGKTESSWSGVVMGGHQITTPTTAASTSVADGESGSLHSAQLAQLKLMVPEDPNVALSEVGDDLTMEDIFSLSGDEDLASQSSAAHQQSALSSARKRMRRKHQSMGGASSRSVSSPEAQHQMRQFLSKYREERAQSQKSQEMAVAAAAQSSL